MSALVEQEALSQDAIAAALLDPRIFIDRHCWIRGKTGQAERFRLWDFQSEVIECFDDEERVLVLKARQLGISWCADGYALWLCTANKGQTVMILSQGQRESKEEMRRIRFMHKRLPPELRRKTGSEVHDAHTPDTTEHLEFPEMDSRIISLPSTEHAGTSYTATLVIIHELAKIQTAATLIPAITPTMADSGRLFVVSTAFGFSGTFYDYWHENGDRWHTGQVVGDKGEEGAFRPVFIPWNKRPGRDERWYNATKKALKDGTMKQEYPATPTEAFQGSADACFTKEFDRYAQTLDATRAKGSIYEVVVGMDMGVSKAYSYLIEVQGATAFVFSEIFLENDTVEGLGHATGREMREYGLDPMEVVVYPDPAGISRNLQTLQTDYDVLKECGLLVDEETHKVSPAQRVDIIKKLLRAGRLWISFNCPDLIDALEKAQWKRRRGPNGTMIREDTYEKDGKHEHPLDAVGYALSRIFPPIAPVAVDSSVGPAPAGNTGGVATHLSGSEFGA